MLPQAPILVDATQTRVQHQDRHDRQDKEEKDRQNDCAGLRERPPLEVIVHHVQNLNYQISYKDNIGGTRKGFLKKMSQKMNTHLTNEFNSTLPVAHLTQQFDLNQYLSGTSVSANKTQQQQSDEQQLLLASLMNEYANLRQTQQSYGIPAIGDLFRSRPEDIQETLTSLFHMLRQRVADLEFRQEARQKWNKLEMDRQEAQDQCTRLKSKNEALANENKDLRNQLTSHELKIKQERERWAQERDELNKRIIQITSKETQYRHEIKSRDIQIEKLKDNYKQNLFEKATKQQKMGGIEILQLHPQGGSLSTVSAMPSDMKYSSMDFQVMVSRNQDEIVRRVCEENSELKECLKALQKEMFDIVDLKTSIYRNRFEAELNINGESTPFDAVRHDLERVREELFGLPFEQAGRELIVKFQRNFQKLRDFMERVDKDIASLTVFNAGLKNGNGNDFDDDLDYGDETENDLNKANRGHPLSPTNKGAKGGASAVPQKARKFKGISSVSQLKHLLRNYDALVEGQHALINQSIAKMSKIPPADEISNTFNRFSILKESELDEMRAFVNEHKAIMSNQYREFEAERRSFEEINQKMEGEKLKIAEERERIEAEVRKIRELNRELTASLCISTK